MTGTRPENGGKKERPAVVQGFGLFLSTLKRYLHRVSRRHKHLKVPGGLRILAFYLPQFHPIPENDAWWGQDFTEWTHVKQARPLFRGHVQPKMPSSGGYYDLRDPAAREQQAKLAREAGIEGFVYWHYWFGNGRRLLERPFNEVLVSGEPAFPFCLAWANESWTGRWHGMKDTILMKQEYPGMKDYRQHFYTLAPAFSDPRYIRVGGKPLFVVYKPWDLPGMEEFTTCWKNLALEHGFPGLFLVGISDEALPGHAGFDGVMPGAPDIPERTVFPTFAGQLIHRVTGINLRLILRVMNRKGPEVFSYTSFVRHSFNRTPEPDEFPVVVPNWDNTPRIGRNGIVLQGSTPEQFSLLLKKAACLMRNRPAEERLLFIKSWNEWAEGNYMEPDENRGKGYLEAIRKITSENQ